MTKYIFVTGGVVSGIGKGISGASLGRLLKDRGLSVFMQKMDPYINVDPGTISPYQHGEVFVTKDGGETDLDLGHYERFIDEELTINSSITSGKVYNAVIQRERRGEYEGATVQVIPHITDEIKQKVYSVARQSGADVIITEIGGTVGDIESLPFIEAIRQIHAENSREDVLFVHTTLIPKIPSSGELKTKPTQHSYKELMSLGIKPNIFIIRCEDVITDDIKEKISLFCDVPVEAIVQSYNVDFIYEVPLSLKAQGLDDYVLHKLNLDLPDSDLSEWKSVVKRYKETTQTLSIGLVGKYVALHDAYLSVSQALEDAGYALGHRVEIQWIDSEEINEKNASNILAGLDGIIIPSGFGRRGIDGMILASRFAREHRVPYFGIGLGMQTAMIDLARHEFGIEGADSTEFNPDTPYPIIDRMVGQDEDTRLGGTLRLGNYTCELKPGTMAYEAYGKDKIDERHRHRFEFNNAFKERFEEEGVVVSGMHSPLDLVEIIEWPAHPFFVGCQFHPEFRSRPNKIHPLFEAFIRASINYKE